MSIDGEQKSFAFPSGIFSLVVSGAEGDAGNINIITDSLSLTNKGEISASTFGQGNAGSIAVATNSVSLKNNATINAVTQSGEGGNIQLQIDDNLRLRTNSSISARAFGSADGGNIDIDANFIIAFPSQNDGNDIVASAEQGIGGNINITTKGIFGIKERTQNPFTNDIDASSDFGLDGTITINTPDVNIFQADTELPESLVESQQTVAQACQKDRLAGKVSGLTIKGKGGIPPEPTEPMNSDAILIDGKIAHPELQLESLDIKPIKTSIGDIYPARGIVKTQDGRIILTPYPTDSIDIRTPQITANCN